MHKLLTTGLVMASLGLSTQANALNILLTNDDGCTAPGINAMYQALTNAGHQVTLVGPRFDSSGISAAGVNLNQTVAYTTLEPGKYCVKAPDGYTPPVDKTGALGTPSDAVNVGISVIMKDSPPDLVVSGTNFGENNGHITQLSGTVNAAVRAMWLGVPAIAVSTEVNMELLIRDRVAAVQQTTAALDDTALFATKVIDKLSANGLKARAACERSKSKNILACNVNILGLPGTTGLNINYPALDASEVKGVAYAPIGVWSTVHYQLQDNNGLVTVVPALPPKPTAEQKQYDGYQLHLGKAVISVIDRNLSADYKLQKSVYNNLRGLTP